MVPLRNKIETRDFSWIEKLLAKTVHEPFPRTRERHKAIVATMIVEYQLQIIIFI